MKVFGYVFALLLFFVYMPLMCFAWVICMVGAKITELSCWILDAAAYLWETK